MDNYEEQRLRRSLTKLSNQCTVNQLKGEMSSESGTETDDQASVAHSPRNTLLVDHEDVEGLSDYEIIHDVNDPARATSTPTDFVNKINDESDYDIISSGNEDSSPNPAQGHRRKLQIETLKLLGKEKQPKDLTNSASSDTLKNEGDFDSDLEDLVKSNQLEVGSNDSILSETGSLVRNNSENNNNEELITVSTENVVHSQRRTMSDLSGSQNDSNVTITLTSPEAVTEDVFCSEGGVVKDQNKNVIERLDLSRLNDNDTPDGSPGSRISEELSELRTIGSSRRELISRDMEEVLGSSPSDSDHTLGEESGEEVQEEIISASEVGSVGCLYFRAHEAGFEFLSVDSKYYAMSSVDLKESRVEVEC